MVFIEVERPIEMRGRCKITGDPGDNPAGWTLGLIQLQWIETNWGYYQGEKDIHGSCFVQRGARRPGRHRAAAIRWPSAEYYSITSWGTIAPWQRRGRRFRLLKVEATDRSLSRPEKIPPGGPPTKTATGSARSWP